MWIHTFYQDFLNNFSAGRPPKKHTKKANGRNWKVGYFLGRLDFQVGTIKKFGSNIHEWNATFDIRYLAIKYNIV